MKPYQRLFDNNKLKEASIPKKFDYIIQVTTQSLEEILAECMNYMFGTQINGLDVVKTENVQIHSPKVVTSKIPLAGSNNTEIEFNIGSGLLKGTIYYYEPTGLLNKHIKPIYWIDCISLDKKAKINKALIKLV